MADVSVLMPGLLEPFAGIDPKAFPGLPAVSTLLSRSTLQRRPARSFEAEACALFNLPADRHAELPVAQLSWLSDYGAACDCALLRADPVHLRADKSELRLFPATQFDLTQAEAERIIESLNAHCRAQGLEFVAPAASRWYVRTDHSPLLTTQPLSEVAGRDIRHYLPEGEAAGGWTGLFNEIQMLLHAHPVNRQRRERGQPEVNSVWFWGGGDLPAVATRCTASVQGRDVLSRGLTRWSGASPVADTADVASAVQAAAASTGRLLLIRDELLPALAGGDFSAWAEALEKQEAALFRPLLKDLKSGRTGSVELLPCHGRAYRIRRWQLYQVWKPVRDFASLVADVRHA